MTLEEWRAALLRGPAWHQVFATPQSAMPICLLEEDELAKLLASGTCRVDWQDQLDRFDAPLAEEDIRAFAGPALASSRDRFFDLFDLAPQPFRPWLDSAVPARSDASGTLHLLDAQPLSHWLEQWRDSGIGPRLPLCQAAQQMLRREAFSGRCDVCSCGEPGCRSDFALVQQGRVLWYLSGDASGVIRAWLLPEIVDECDPCERGPD